MSSNNSLKNCLFGASKVTKPGDTTDCHKYIYSGHGIGFDRTGLSAHPNGGAGRNVVMFGSESSNSIHATNKTQRILLLGHGLVQKKKTIPQPMQKKCIRLILVQKIKHFV